VIHFLHLKRRKWFAMADFLTITISIFLGYFVRTKIPIPLFDGLIASSPPSGFENIGLVLAVSGVTFVFVQYAFGVYDLWHSSSFANWLQRTLPANLAVAFSAFTFLYITQNFSFPRSLVAAVFIFSYLISSLWRVIYFSITEVDQSDVVLVGKWTDLKKLMVELVTPPFDHHVRIVAVFVPEVTSDIPPEKKRTYLVLPFSEFERYSETNPYASILIAPSDAFQQQAFQCVISAARRGISIYAVPTIYEILLGRLQHLRINDLPLLELRLNPASNMSLALKRALDFCLALFLIVLLGIPMMIIGALVKLTSSGPAIYSQVRIGLMGKEFRIYKFRSMKEDSEETSGFKQASANDPRFTKIGKFIRACRLDELPQIWNILKGDMSFVGPRPLVRPEVQKFELEIPGFAERHRVRPGITGLAQVSGNYLTNSEVKLKYDLAYVSNQNVVFDTQIILRTIKIIFTKAGQ
jgi:exopolysaccharide biosynthesis polyprenyl glycosylphosphotransferase